MKVSINLAQYYSNVDLKSIPTDVMLQKIGAQLGAVEDVEYWAPKYAGIYVAKIVSCEPHPDSDHMHVCQLDVGNDERHSKLKTQNSKLVQVVCGAPNVAEGQLVAWLAPGSTVPSSFGDTEPFILGSRNLRGVMSNGMIGSLKELAMGDSHEGILVIDPADVGDELVRPGTEFVKLYGNDDVVIDCENKMFTHRPDCFGILGVARELAGINGLKFESPEWYLNATENMASNCLKLSSKNDIPQKVSRFMVQSIQGVKNGSSPIWLQAFLTRVGSRPISNLVDISNYFMHLTAQPTHAFDHDKLVKLVGTQDIAIYPRMAKKSEKIALLNGKTIELNEADMVIACNDVAVALAGVMGGSETECDENTTNIVIECATFDMYTVRRTSMRHGLFTDAVTRYNKGQSPLQNDKVLAQIVKDVVRMCGGVPGVVIDSNPEIKVCQSEPINISVEFINSRLGSELSTNDVHDLLLRVEINSSTDGKKFVIYPPFWRTDLELKEDIVEEIGRLYGYDQLPVVLPARAAKPVARNSLLDFKTSLREQLSKNGANEVLTYSFVHGDLLRKTGTDPEKWAYHIRNAVSPDLQYYRTSVIPSLLAKIQPNLRSDMVRGDDNEFAMFEIGKAHAKGHLGKDDESMDQRPERAELPLEYERLAFVIAADEKTASRKYSGSAYFAAKKYLSYVINGQATYTPLETNEYPICAAYQIGRSAMVYVDGELLGVIGEFRSDVKKSLKLPDYCAGFELDILLLQNKLKKSQYQPMGTFPKTVQDITLEAASTVSYADLHACLMDELNVVHVDKGYDATLGPRDIFKADDSDKTRTTFRLWLSHKDKTLVQNEANAVVDQLAKKAESSMGAVQI
jgi:phenylalanyl-tRNA synthetase beta chain